MKESSLRKLIVTGAVLAIATIGCAGAKQLTNIKNLASDSASANNTIKIETVLEESNFDQDPVTFVSSINREPLLASSIMDDFEEATESTDESDVQEKGVETLVAESKQKIIDYLNINSSKLEGEDKSYIENYDSDEELAVLFSNAGSFNKFAQHDWENNEFETGLNSLINDYRILAGIEEVVTTPAEGTAADQIADKTSDIIDETTADINQNPTNDEKTELSETFFRGIADDVWKISGLVALGAVAGAVALGVGIGKGVKKGKKKSITLNEANYLVGKEYQKKIKELSSTSAKIDEIKNKINLYNKRAIKANTVKKIEYLQKAKELENSEYYSQLKNNKNKLVAIINSALEGGLSTDLAKLKLLKNYARDSRSLVKIPEKKYKKFGTKISGPVKSYNRLEKSIERKLENNSSFGMKKKQKALNQKKEKILSELKSANLTGSPKISLNNFLNNSDKLFTKDNLADLEKFANGLKKRDNGALGIFKKSMKLLEKTASAEICDMKGNYKKSFKIKKSANDLYDKIKKFRPNIESNYYGYINNIKNIPINPNRFICADKSIDSKGMNSFFDKVSTSYIQKDQKVHELTLSYLQNGKEKTMICSYDNQDAIDLMKSKFLTEVPKCSKVEIVEKTMSLNKSNKVIKTEYDIERNPKGFEKAVKEANFTISGFNNLLENKENLISEVIPERAPKIKHKIDSKKKSAVEKAPIVDSNETDVEKIKRLMVLDGRDF